MLLRPRSDFFALSIRQPWAFLVVTAQKNLELRTWGTNHRGPIVIHASRQVDEVAAAYFGFEIVSWPVGVALGVVQIVDVLTLGRRELVRCQSSHRSWGPFTHGMRGWVFSKQQVLANPVAMRGSKGLFPIPDEEVRQIVEQL